VPGGAVAATPPAAERAVVAPVVTAPVVTASSVSASPVPAPPVSAPPAAAGAVSEPPAAAPGQAVPAPAAATQPPGDVPDSAGLRRLWPDVLDQVRARSRRTRALLDNASISTVDATVIKLAATSAAIAKMISDESNLSVLRDSLAAVIGGGWQIEVVVDQGPAGMAPAAAVPPTNGRSVPAQAPPQPVDDDGVDEDGDEVSGLAGIGGDPEAVAIALLQDSLGARPIEGNG
jgi:DNA polymerase-3 subunit gamma/tau